MRSRLGRSCAGLTKWIGYCSAGRPHSGLGGQTPSDAYGAGRRDEIGGLTTTRAELNQAAKLAEGWGPPHSKAIRVTRPRQKAWIRPPAARAMTKPIGIIMPSTKRYSVRVTCSPDP